MIWNLVYWVLLVSAILVGLRALFWDRAGFRGRAKLRCRKCWYDLTASPGDLKDGPIVCSECGKKHASRRAMRKTRRSRRWVLVALVFWMGAYGASVTPSVQKRGWVAAVPRSALALSIPFFDGKVGSSYDMTMWGYKPKKTVWDQVAGEIQRQWRPRSWIADRLVFLLARMDSEKVLTDSTTKRGTLYGSWINRVIRRDAACGFEERWARSVAYAKFYTRERWAPGATVFGELKVRRLVQGVYRVDVGMNVAWFESRTRSDSVTIGGGSYGGGPGIRNPGEYIQSQQWDLLKRRPRIPYGESSKGEMMVSRYQLDPSAAGMQTRTVPVTVYEQFGDPRLSVRWEEVASTQAPFKFIADPDADPEVVEDPKLADLLDSYIDAELVFRFDREHTQWQLVAHLTNDGLKSTQAITFGGQVSIEVEQRSGQQVSYKPLLSGPKKWWRWVPATRPPEDMDENTREYWELWRDGMVVPSGSESVFADDAWGVPFEDHGWNVKKKNSDGRLVLRVHTEDSDFNRIVFSDLEAKRVLFGDLVFPIKNWTVEEMNRYRVSGEIPDHAMP